MGKTREAIELLDQRVQSLIDELTSGWATDIKEALKKTAEEIRDSRSSAFKLIKIKELLDQHLGASDEDILIRISRLAKENKLNKQANYTDYFEDLQDFKHAAYKYLGIHPETSIERALEVLKAILGIESLYREYEIWSEGFQANGQSEEALYHGTVKAKSFSEACDRLARISISFRKNYDPKGPSWWGSRLYDNEADARKAFG